MNIEGEKAYQVYHLGVVWHQDGDSEYSKSLKNGRIRNSTSSYRMYKKETSYDDVRNVGLKWWAKISNKEKYDGKHLLLIRIEVIFQGYETWCGSWFNHWTFDMGQTDEEVVRSFERFVYRKTILNEKNGHYNNQWHSIAEDNPYYCLMGAEDRYRWSASEEYGADKIPCRCEGCKKYGVLRICH